MKRILLVALFTVFTLTLFPQKACIQVVKTRNVARSEWMILDEQFNPIFRGDEYFRDDSIPLSLESGKRYQLEISVSEVFRADTTLYRLYVNGEPVLLVNSDITPGDHFFYFFTGTRQEVNKITGGTDASISAFPWQVYIQSGFYDCGGSIISGDWIMTAAHCTEDDAGNPIPAARIDVIVGANNPISGLEGKKYFVSQVIVHENYNSTTLENDIALLKLSQTINYPNATPVKLASAKDAAAGLTDPGVFAWVTGYGEISVNPPVLPATLQKVQLPIISNTQASVVWHTIPSTDLMAGFLNGGKDACSGDSGGPMVVPYFNGFKQAGIVSWGSGECNTYGAYTRVSLFETWISLKTGIEISYAPPVPTGDSIVCQGITSSIYSVGTVTGATAYDWQLLPANAGHISGTSNQAAVTWNSSFTGKADVMLRVTHNNSLSDWSVLNVQVAGKTRIIRQSSDTVICAGEYIGLNVMSEGYNLKYSWYKNDTIFRSGVLNEISFVNATVANSGKYICNIVGSCGSTASLPMNLTVLPQTGITNLTPDSEITFGGAITLRVTADGNNLSYQWEKDTVRLINATTPEFELHDLNANDAGLYRVVVKGTCGTMSSKGIYVYVKKKDYSGEPEVFVWPTLINDRFNVALSNEEYYNLLLFNVNGKRLIEKNGCRYVTLIETGSLPPGVYIIMVYNGNFRKSIKLIK